MMTVISWYWGWIFAFIARPFRNRRAGL
jgi:hypothetical protein